MAHKIPRSRSWFAIWGFSTLKWKFGSKKGRIVSAYSRGSNSQLILGETALIKSGSSCLKTPPQLIEFYPAFVEEAIKEAGVTSPVALAVGLPYQYYLEEKAKDDAISAIKQLQQILKKDLVTEVFVFPQGLGGIVSFLDNSEDTDGNILAIDIGFNTIISLLYSGKVQDIVYGETYYKRGIQQMATQLVLPHIKPHIPGRSLTPVELNYIMERGYIQFGMEQIDFMPEIREAGKSYAEDTLADIVSDLRAHLGGAAVFKDVIFFGGGTRLIPEMTSERVRITNLQEPEFANAAGFESLALYRLRKNNEANIEVAA